MHFVTTRRHLTASLLHSLPNESATYFSNCVGYNRLTLTHFLEQDSSTEGDNARLAKVFVTYQETRMLFVVFVIFRNVTPPWTKSDLHLKP